MAQPRLTVELGEWQTVEPRPGSLLEGAVLAHATARKHAEFLTASGILSVEELRAGLRVQATSFVGRVHIGDLQVTVRPKIGQIRLLRLLRYAYGLRDLRLYEQVGYQAAIDAFPDLC